MKKLIEHKNAAIGHQHAMWRFCYKHCALCEKCKLQLGEHLISHQAQNNKQTDNGVEISNTYRKNSAMKCF